MASISTPVTSAEAARLRTVRRIDRKRLRQNVPILIMFLPVVLYFLIFRYAPMAGLIIAFKNYNFTDGIFGSPWVGLGNFRMLFTQPSTLQVIRNTFVLSVLQVVSDFLFRSCWRFC
ncbi:hypothetical protein O9H85_33405 [Paenibacillus filicis]|uniref:Sugar ABC transporter permease n=1 Tax=Paenibacillus gyeongsangnamensis TaxID=3388067 RepID=A0ABT4QKC8_9BACL|nr:hypothetical protein [Paenibacillus filicis]MCZ8517165.1 hypothetical protein [Paenibacillus filicis]